MSYADANYQKARQIVADDVRESYPDLCDDDAIDHVINTVDIEDVDLDGEDVSAAYLLVLAMDQMAVTQ